MTGRTRAGKRAIGRLSGATWVVLGAFLTATLGSAALAKPGQEGSRLGEWAQQVLPRDPEVSLNQPASRLVLEEALVRLSERGDFAQIAAGADWFWDQFPEELWLQEQIAQQLLRTREFELAVVPLRRASDAAADPALLALLAATEWELGEIARAERAFERAYQAARESNDPDAAFSARRQLGTLRLWAGDGQKAVDALSEARELLAGERDSQLDLDLGRAYEGVAASLSRAGESPREALRAALSFFDSALSGLPQNAEVHYGRGRVLTRLGAHQEAEEALSIYRRLYAEDQARIRATGRFAAQMTAAREHMASGRFAEAIRLLQSMPPRVEALEILAEAHLAVGQREEARGALQRAIALEPRRSDLMVKLNALLFEE